MRHFLFLLLLPVCAQAQIMGKSVPDYTTKLGTTFHKGDTLHLALGTDIGGRFKYGEVPRNMLGTPRMPFNANYANQLLVIKDLRLQNLNKHMAPRTVAVVSTGGLNGQVDLEAAEEVGEIKTAHNQKAAPAVAAAATSTGIADELLKLKRLLDAGVITQAEFDSQKAKLLGR